MKRKEEMSKIGLVTFTYGCNYGQRLQNYAVQSILSQFGYTTYTLRQKEPIKKKVRNSIQAFKEKQFVKFILRNIAFRNFDNKFIIFYWRKISGKRNPTYLNNEFDYFVCGSDQIWSPVSDDVNDTMFLSFAERTKRIAFAPSIGVDSIPDSKKESYTKFFLGFDNISVRENSAAEIVYDLTKLKATVLMDPTLMIDVKEWESIEKKPNFDLPERYLLYYHLGIDRYKSKVNTIAEELDSQPLDLLLNKKLFCTGPCEFIWLIHHAQGVVTDSYHGTIFSMLFHIPFWVFKRENENIDMGCRFYTLFELFPSMSHYVDDFQNSFVYNFDEFEEKREIEKERASFFLNNALHKTKISI